MQIIFLALLMFSSVTFAKTLRVKFGLMEHTLEYGVPTLTLKGKGLDLSETKQKCNEEAVTRFEKTLERALSKSVLKTSKISQSVEINLDGKTFYERQGHPTALFLIKLKEPFELMKLNSKFLCEKKP